MKHIIRTFIILAAALVVVGVAILLSNSLGATRRRGLPTLNSADPGSALFQRGPDEARVLAGFEPNRFLGDLDRGRGSRLNWVGLSTVIRNLVVIAGIVLAVTLVGNTAKHLRRPAHSRQAKEQAGSGSGA